MSKFLDGNGLLYLWGKIKAMLSEKVDKAEGKVLSSNDYTDEEKSKLGGLEKYTLPVAGTETLGGIMVGAGLAMSNGVLSVTGGKADAVEWEDILNRPELALKSDLTSLYRFRGSVDNFAALPEQGNEKGDVWDVKANGMNYAWTGEDWDALGQAFEIESISNAEINAILDGV